MKGRRGKQRRKEGSLVCVSFRHSIVPVVPVDLLEYTQLPSTYIMGIHSSLREQISIEMVRERERGMREGEGEREREREGGERGRERERERERERLTSSRPPHSWS